MKEWFPIDPLQNSHFDRPLDRKFWLRGTIECRGDLLRLLRSALGTSRTPRNDTPHNALFPSYKTT